ncbi:pro-sigmaK processing inhibitor BofA family protein [Mahella australiensis]|uniref:Pro-sigmaK processing inhibitor BofA n=1 Tax=Mahella australiensis (strain DSM 15567 / CIP 107919 / 50-1 BON) TaxID=697281 RepID=F3ZWF3_MAHA5|nr:pro-sigmaK processing inhibitor BofA family protein [Mahella australiensis]AEE95388.1 pro-sigmaK processing inhibitor BofA [Mahella australiensis 50-1 BON]
MWWFNLLAIDIQFSTILAFAGGLVLLYLVGWLLLVPLKIVWRLIYNGIIGGVVLWLLNLIGSYFGFTLAINPLTALIVGFLGVPGVILLVILKFILP